MPLDIPGIPCLHMKFTWSVTDFTARIFQLWRLFRTDKTSGLSIPGSMAVIASLYLFLCQSLSHSLDAPEGVAFPCIGCKALILLFMAGFKREGDDICR